MARFQPSGMSATHEEYLEARERCDVLVMVQEGVERERQQQEFLTDLQTWTAGHYTKPFSTPDNLRDAVTRALHELELSRATGPVDGNEILTRARALVPDGRGSAAAALAVAVAGGPSQTILRPSRLESADLSDVLNREALFGEHRVFGTESGTRKRIDGSRLILDQKDAGVIVDAQGSILVVTPIDRAGSGMLPAIIQEDLQEQILKSLRFVDTVLDGIDSIHRLTHLVPVASLPGASYLGWQTRVENARSQSSVPLGLGAEGGPVSLEPPHRPRAALRMSATEIAEDLVVLLRRSRGR